MIQVTMIENDWGQDRDQKGIATPVRCYLKGKTYEVCGDLAKCFEERKTGKLGAGFTEEPQAQSKPSPRKKKFFRAAPENKGR